MDILEHNYFHFYNVFIPDQYKQLRIDFENILEDGPPWWYQKN